MQLRAGAALMAGQGDLLISAGTAGGKTEAAFLPAISLIDRVQPQSVGVICVSPLKSLINDQYQRLRPLAAEHGLPIVRWHGDESRDAKEAFFKTARGICLITPESIEALLLHRAGRLRGVFGQLQFVIIDELHAFLTGDRGAHLASLLERLEDASGASPRRIGLSATLGDPAIAARWLRPGGSDRVALVTDGKKGVDLDAALHVALDPPRLPGMDDTMAEDAGIETGLMQTATRLDQRLGTGKNLVFAGSRRMTEALCDILRRRRSAAGQANVFFAHHGSLSREVRETAERRLRDPDVANATAIATTTLELGIDIGDVGTVCQIGPPRSVSGLRQRVGRSGRRAGTRSTLDLSLIELEGLEQHQEGRLRLNLVCAAAALSLLREGFVEPPGERPASLSVVVHETLCLLRSRGELSFDQIVSVLARSQPMSGVGPASFEKLYQAMARPEVRLLEYRNGMIGLGPKGVQLAGSPDIYAVFSTPFEIDLVHAGMPLGRLPLMGGSAIGPGDGVLFAGARWSIMKLDIDKRVAEVQPSDKGKQPRFEGGDQEPMHDRLAARMRAILAGHHVDEAWTPAARRMLSNARAGYRAQELDRFVSLNEREGLILLPWIGTRKLEALTMALCGEGLNATAGPYGLWVASVSSETLKPVLERVRREARARVGTWLSRKGAIPEGKFDAALPHRFRLEWWAAANTVATLASEAAATVLAGGAQPA